MYEILKLASVFARFLNNGQHIAVRVISSGHDTGGGGGLVGIILDITRMTNMESLFKKLPSYFPAALYGYKTWSLTLSEDHRLRVCEKR
jgi:hypothetical protein